MTPQQSIGHYRILGKLGEGGMGAVYRATDSKLNRDVAVKVLPPALSGDADRMQRFEREAQLLASLNHPNIAAIYGVEQGAIVMELVEGDELKGPVPLDTAIRYARQIVAGLEAAHEKGIVHRDLKPANIKVTPEGTVKLLDFGLAKAAGDLAAASGTPGASPTISPTLSLAMTQAGMILGTAAYMSPEQARGKPVDKRADIWAFGVVFFELLTGRPLFGGGETVTDTLASVVKDAPDLETLPPATPPHVRALIARCLAKDPAFRLRDIGEARIVLDSPPPAPARVSERAPRRSAALPWIAAAGALAAATFAVLWLRGPAEDAPVVKFTVAPPAKNSRYATGVPQLSPDGRHIVFTAETDGKSELWLRDLDTVTARPLAPGDGTLASAAAFWSPDSRSIGFFSNGKLKRIDLAGGPPRTVCDAPSPRGGAWNQQDVILFGFSGGAPLMRVPAAGGIPTAATTVDAAAGESSHRWPVFLPDGRHFLFVARNSDPEKTSLWVGDLESKTRRQIRGVASNAAFDPRGFLLFTRENTLFAQPFHPGRFELSGDAFPVAENVDFSIAASLGQFSISPGGALAFYSGAASSEDHLTWLDRTGKPLGTIGSPAAMRQPAISPDGTMVAIDRMDPATSTSDIWLHDLVHSTDSRFTFDPRDDNYPSWSPDGSRVLFLSNRGGKWALWAKAASGAGKEEVLFESNDFKFDAQWSRDGNFAVFSNRDAGKTGNDVWVLSNVMGGATLRKAYPFVQTEAAEWGGRLSPDGKYLAYNSDESRVPQVYVQSFPGKEGKFQISTNGGSRAVWSRDGKELFYISLDQKLMAVDVQTSPAFQHGVPKALFDARYSALSRFDISPDGKRFLVVSPSPETAGASMQVVLNWRAAAARR